MERQTGRSQRRGGPLLSRSRAVTLLVMVVAASFLLDFGRRAWDIYRLGRQVEALGQQVEAARAEQARLQARLAYVQTDAYLEEAARDILRWTRPDEVQVIILPVPQGSPPSPAESVEGSASLPYWRLWWQLLFGPGLEPSP